jgi:hypothetical protein
MLASAGFAQLTFTITKTAGSYTITCDTTSVTIQAVSNYSIPPSFSFITPSSQTLSGSTQTITTTGVWTVTANAGTATASQTMAISVNTTVPTLTIVSSATVITCNTPSVLLSGTVNPLNILITWIEPGVGLGCTSTTCIASMPGNYGMNIIDPANGCQASATISIGDNRVYPILAPASLFTVACPNGTVDLSVPVQSSTIGLLYQWFSPTGAVANGSNTPILNTNAPGAYTITVTNPSNGCSTTTVVLVYACVGIEEIILNSTSVMLRLN